MISRRKFLFTPAALALSGSHARSQNVQAPPDSQPPLRSPNIVLIVATHWRAQSVPWAGDPNLSASNLAPNLVRFAKESLTFSRAYSACPRSAEAKHALLTGRFPHAGGGVPLDTLLVFAGYRTGAFATRETDALISFVHANGPFYALWSLAEPGGFAERVDPSTLHVRENVPPFYESSARQRMAEFYSHIPAWDREIGVLLAGLDRPGLLENTIVIFTSDCGEQMGSHGVMGSGLPYEESVRIPLAIRFPRAIPNPGESDLLISQVDIAPTLLSIAGAPASGDAQGQDLSKLILEQKGERPEAIYAEAEPGREDQWRMLVQGYDKLVTQGGVVQHLFNLVDDPYEVNDLATAASEQLKRDALLAMKQAWARKLGDGVDPSSGLKIR